MIIWYILIILSVFISILDLLLSIKNLKLARKQLDNVKQKIQKFNSEYLHSLEFNTKLDGYIQTLLDKYSNEEIAKKICNKLMNDDPILKDVDQEELERYILDTLRNYNNKYTENHIKYEDLSKFETFIDVNESSLNEQVYSNKDKGIDLTNAMNDFYK